MTNFWGNNLKKKNIYNGLWGEKPKDKLKLISFYVSKKGSNLNENGEGVDVYRLVNKSALGFKIKQIKTIRHCYGGGCIC
jgi:hypothetical protein